MGAPEEEYAGLDDTTPKRALLIPLGVFTSNHIMKIATATGMSNYLTFFIEIMLKLSNLWKSTHNLMLLEKTYSKDPFNCTLNFC